MPSILVSGGSGDANAANGLMATLTGLFAKSLHPPATAVAPTEAPPPKTQSY
jgi:hypothetical protein